MGHEVWKFDNSPLLIKMVSTDDYATPATGLSPTVQVSKDGGALGSAGSVSEIGGGWYKVAQSGTYGSGDPIGPILLVGTAAGAYGSALYSLVEVSKSTGIAEQVWGVELSTYIGDDSIGCAMYNAFRGYQRTASEPLGNSHPGAAPEGVVGFRLSSDGLDKVVVETGVNARQALALIGAATAGKASGLATTTATFYAMGASGTTTVRIVAGTDASGNRVTTTLTPPT